MKLVQHPSHVMGTVEGELRCVRCYAAPDWPIIEHACGSVPRADTSARDALILAAYASDPRVKRIARELGISRETVSRTISRHTQGLSAERQEARTRGAAFTAEDMRTAMEHQAAGRSWREIGELMGRKPQSIQSAVIDFRRGKGPLVAKVVDGQQQEGV